MKSLLSILLVVLYTVALIKPLYPLVEYAVRIEEYKARCINKAKPEMHCNGKCILAQKLRTINREGPDPVAPVLPKINPDDFPCCIACYNEVETMAVKSRSAYTLTPTVAQPRSVVVDVFRPPQA